MTYKTVDRGRDKSNYMICCLFKDLPRKKKQRLCILILRIIIVTNHVLIVSIVTTNSAIIEPVPSAKKLINKIKSPSSIINMLKLLLYVRTFILLFE